MRLADLRSLIDEATTDCYGEHEENVALLTMIEENVRPPFFASIAGVTVRVDRLVWARDRDVINAIFDRGGKRHALELGLLEWIEPYPKGFEWIEAYLLWRGGSSSARPKPRTASYGSYDTFWGSYDYQPRIKPRDGIKAQSKRGVFGESWWAKRWIAVLTSFDIGGRLSRGRSYARSGQVLSIEIAEGKVKAKVQGSRPKPYEISIVLKPLRKEDWRRLADLLCQHAIFAAKLLAGEMPQGIEEGFRDAGLSLFPSRLRDLETECSCPDWSNPCKHIAAVYYLIGEEFDRDPFLLFKLRGMGREEFLGLLGSEPAKSDARRLVRDEAPDVAPEPLTSDVERFWLSGALPEDILGEVRVPPVAAALPRRLGNFPFWRGRERFLDAMQEVYASSAHRALDLATVGRLTLSPNEDAALPGKTAAIESDSAIPARRGKNGTVP